MTGTKRLHIPPNGQKLPKQPGELARFRVFHGPDSGSVFVLTTLSATIGRGEESDIVLSDLKASRKHAEFKGTQNGNGITWVVRDCGSVNGILHNGKLTKESPMRLGDTVSLGETTLEMADSDAVPKGETQFSIDRAAMGRRIEMVRAFGTRSSSSSQSKNPLILLAAGAAVGFFLMIGGPSEGPVSSRDNEIGSGSTEALASRDLASFLPPGALSSADGGASAREAESFFRAGFREYRERNLLRARSQFETALQISPSHTLAQLYLKNVEARIEEEVTFNIESGARKQEAGKLREARTHYSAVLRLLYRDPNSPQFTTAKEKIEAIDRTLEKSKEGGSS